MSATISTAIHDIFEQAAGPYGVIFGTDAGAFFMDVEKKSDENLPFFGIFDTFRSRADDYGVIHPIYAIYAFYSPDWGDEAKETTEEEITAVGLLRAYLAALSPYILGAPSSYQRFAGDATSGAWAEIALNPPTDCDGVPIIPPPPVDIAVLPLLAEENGEYVAPPGTAYSPVTVAVPTPVIEELPLIVERNGVTESPEGVRYNPIAVNVPQQTATDHNLFTRTHTLRGLTLWNPNQPIQDVRGWQVSRWGGGGSNYINKWSASGDVVIGISEMHTNSFLQIVDLEPGDYRIKFFYKNGSSGGVYVWGRNPWNGTSSGDLVFFTKPNSTTWAEVDEIISIPTSGRWRISVGQDVYTSQWLYISRPLLTPVDSGVTDYVPAASDIAEHYYDNADFVE